jgi:uroporphyrinogen-III synthase
MKILIIRPEPGASASAARALAAGFEPVCLPFFEIAPRPWQAPDPQLFDAVMVTSSNAIRKAGAQLDKLHSLPFHAVGARSADAVRAAGLTLASTGTAGVEALVASAAAVGHSRLLWLAGEDRTKIDPPAGSTIDILTVYASDPVALGPEAGAMIASCPIVALHSARAATTFGDYVDNSGLTRQRFTLAAFSPAIGAAAGPGWAGIATAATPDDAALLSQAHMLVRQTLKRNDKGNGF